MIADQIVTSSNIVELLAAIAATISAIGTVIIGVITAVKGGKIASGVDAIQANTKTKNGSTLAQTLEQVHQATSTIRTRSTDPAGGVTIVTPNPSPSDPQTPPPSPT